jgi:transposase-like protein
MPQNPIQFQNGMSLNELSERYGTEAQCEQALERARWPGGFVCPACGGREHSRFVADGRRYWQCSTCRSQSTVCSGTLFHASKLSLTSWFQAIYLVTQNKNNISALSLKRHLGVAYATAWRLKHKLLEAMRQRESRRLLQGVVFADDAVLGGAQAGKPGRGSENKQPFMAAVELTEEGHPLHVRFDAIADYTGATFAAWAQSALHPTVHLVSDGCASFNAAGAQVAAHGAIIVGKRKSSELEPFRWVNLFISNLKTAISGTYHHFDFAKYRHRYLAEAQYRVNHRFDLASLVGRLADTCVHTAPCPERWLRLAEIGAAEGSS